jgi:hypothetical protein
VAIKLRSTYEPQKQHALLMWAARLLDIVEGRDRDPKIVPLRG